MAYSWPSHCKRYLDCMALDKQFHQSKAIILLTKPFHCLTHLPRKARWPVYWADAFWILASLHMHGNNFSHLEYSPTAPLTDFIHLECLSLCKMKEKFVLCRWIMADWVGAGITGRSCQALEGKKAASLPLCQPTDWWAPPILSPVKPPQEKKLTPAQGPPKTILNSVWKLRVSNNSASILQWFLCSATAIS